jgi:hypothetical protein
VKPDCEESQKSTNTAQKQEPSNAKDYPPKGHIRSLPNDSKERKGHDTKRQSYAQAGSEAKPGQKLRRCVCPRPLQQNRKDISSEEPTPENKETEEHDEPCEKINNA